MEGVKPLLLRIRLRGVGYLIRTSFEVFWAHLPRGRPSAHWRDYISHQDRERLRIPQVETETLVILLPRCGHIAALVYFWKTAMSVCFPSTQTAIQTMKCMRGATTPWASVARGIPQGQSPNPRRLSAWTESPFSRSQPGLLTAWHGQRCPETGQLPSEAHVRWGGRGVRSGGIV